MMALKLLAGARRKSRRFAGLALAFCAFIVVSPSRADAAVCLYVSSYHPDYYWNAEIEKGLDATLNGACEVSRFSRTYSLTQL